MSPTTQSTRVRLVADAVVASYIRDISARPAAPPRQRPQPQPRARRLRQARDHRDLARAA